MSKKFAQSLVTAALALVGFAAAPHVSPTPNPLFARLIPSLKQHTEVPVYLPTVVLQYGDKVYARIGQATKNSYRIELSLSPTCNGADTCRFGEIGGDYLGASPPALTGKKVVLKSGIAAYYVNPKCGALCNDATITWDLNGYRYFVGFQAATQTDWLDEPNSFVRF